MHISSTILPCSHSNINHSTKHLVVIACVKFQAKLLAHGAVIEKEYTISMIYEVVIPVHVTPVEGQVYDRPLIVDYKDKKNQSVPVRGYVAAVFHGGMNSKAFNGIRRGQTIKRDGIGKKIHDFYGMYFDPALTANHGSQEVSGEVIDLQEIWGESFLVPLYPTMLASPIRL